MLKVKCMLVVGGPGSRTDFVAGWLGTLPNFVDMHWGLDPVTHQSIGKMGFSKMLDYDHTFEAILPRQFELLQEAETYLPGTCHGRNLGPLQDKIDKGLVRILSIDTSSPALDTAKLKWEWIVHTYLARNDRPSYSRAVRDKKWLIDDRIDKPADEITYKDRIDAVNELFATPMFFNNPNAHLNAITVNYADLFSKDGSRYLCDKLEFSLEDAYHDYWNHMLAIADAPDTITVWGHTWRRQDCVTD